MKMARILSIVTYGYGAFVIFLSAVFVSAVFWPLNRFVGWLMFEYNPNPPVWITVTGTVVLVLAVYGLISAIFFIVETARIISRKTGERKEKLNSSRSRFSNEHSLPCAFSLASWGLFSVRAFR